MKLVVIDYESGNLRSVSRALESQGVTPLVSSGLADLAAADAVVLPGVGSGPAAMAALDQRGLVGPIRDYIASGRPFLGVCLGLQLLMDRTEEGDKPCLGVVQGDAKLLPPGQKVPHMGWNNVKFNKKHPVLAGIPQDSYFYFVHSYYAAPNDPASVAGTTEYGIPFCSIYARDNLIATQFHPEKSGPAGLRLYKNFIGLAS
ncbi:MAG: imidazole glycerol phosphate synthase subunit HisH [Chloroflexi bacterium]|nr:imidazole glycerol phosphate synthase subunit HisH [Chloroflexota bacterium]MDA1271209.1 imidazole glycerol phosphate synthase subunit HisH [Chloroflexota bacterium]PKB59646.1 MAG: imidazole glycerol phosphate synthase subunit HisH [SAR202 cluster bacterium Casp-Chloro-G2]